MKNNKISAFKIIMSIMFAILVFGAYFYFIFGNFPLKISKFEVEPQYLSFACICICFLFSLMFIRKSPKKILITLALAANVAADYFLVLFPLPENKLTGVCIFCGVQFFYLIYTLVLNRGRGTRIVNIATRVALCLLIYFILPNYIVLSTLELVSLMYIANFFVSLLVFLLHIKTEKLLFLGFLLFFACDIFVGLTNGGASFIPMNAAFLNFIFSYDIAFYCYIPGVFFVALSSMWAKKKKQE